MKKLRFFLYVMALACVVTGCRKPVDLSFGVETQSFASTGETCTVEVKSNGDWTVNAFPEWITVTPESGNGDAVLTLVAQPNTTGENRTGAVEASTKDASATLKVSQGFVSFGISPTSIECDERGGDFPITISTQMAWSISSLPDWIVCSMMEGTGNAVVTLTVSALSGESRRADVVFGNETFSEHLRIVQNSTPEPQHYLNVTPTSVNMACTGESKRIAIVCDEEWEVFFDQDWVSLDKNNGNGDDEIMVTVGENPEFEPRQAVLKIVSSSDLVEGVIIDQEASPIPHYLEVSPREITFSKEGGSQELVIGCYGQWKISLESDWATVFPDEGEGDGLAKITVDANIYNEPREVKAHVVSDDLAQDVRLVQEPGDVNLIATFDPDTLFLNYVGGVRTLNLTSNVDWTLSFPSWVMFFTTSGSGDASLEFLVDANSSSEQRIGYVQVLFNQMVIGTAVIVQEGRFYTLETDWTELQVRPEGGTFVVNVTANQGWTVNPSVSWIKASPLEGYGNGRITFTIMPSTEPRTAQVKLSGAVEKVILLTIIQE